METKTEIKRNVKINAKWPGNRRRSHEVLALVIYPASEEQKEEYDILQGAWVIYDGQLIEAFYFDGYGWQLDDIGLGEISVNDAPDGYPGAEYLKGSGWHLETYLSPVCNEFFYKPVKDE